MSRFLSFILSFIFCWNFSAQVSSKYNVSFENAVHHEAHIRAEFSNLKSDTIQLTMSRSSPGRYALHEFVKNVYEVKISDADGNKLDFFRKDPYSWYVFGHSGTIAVEYTLFANHGDGTYAQIDETHAHLNMPATFMYVPELAEDGFQVIYEVRKDLNWKVATQLQHVENTTYRAENLQYFMDSPTEIANFKKRSFEVEGQTISMILHDDKATDTDFNVYFEDVKKIVLEQKAVFGELPTYDYGEYTFLACYMPNATPDAMEHRNSTYVVSTRSLANGGIEENIGTVSHEFFHCWNVERIRPKSLEPFDFSQVNMSGELWFAEGFTNYFDALTLCRSGIWTREYYLQNMGLVFNYVWSSAGRDFYNPIEMSYQAPFVDAAKSVDEDNRGNTFISYYSYGEMLGLALDLTLRENNLNLDDYMKMVWNNFGKTNRNYTIEDLKNTLKDYTGKALAEEFFSSYIYKSGMPNFERLFKNVGIELTAKDVIEFGAFVRHQKIMNHPKKGSSAYLAGFQKDDKILQIDAVELEGNVDINAILNKFMVGEVVNVKFERYGEIKETSLKISTDKRYEIRLMDTSKISSQIQKNQDNWLNSKVKY